MVIYGKEIDFKYTRLKDAERFEKAIEELQKATDKTSEKPPEKISSTVKIVVNNYSKFFKTATGQDVLEGCEDMEEAVDAYYEFIYAIERQKAMGVVKRSALNQKYLHLAKLVGERK